MGGRRWLWWGLICGGGGGGGVQMVVVQVVAVAVVHMIVRVLRAIYGNTVTNSAVGNAYVVVGVTRWMTCCPCSCATNRSWSQ